MAEILPSQSYRPVREPRVPKEQKLGRDEFVLILSSILHKVKAEGNITNKEDFPKLGKNSLGITFLKEGGKQQLKMSVVRVRVGIRRAEGML